MSAAKKQMSVAEVEAQVASEAALLREAYDAQILPALLELDAIDRSYVEAQIVPLLARQMQVLVLKGGDPSSDTGNAAVKKAMLSALGALEYDDTSLGFVRIGAEAGETLEARCALAERVIELADPEAVVAIDEAAWELLGERVVAAGDSGGAKGQSKKAQGAAAEDTRLASVRGRQLVYVGDFEAALSNEKEKQRSWALLKTIKRETTIY